jgi:hypothetical protein
MSIANNQIENFNSGNDEITLREVIIKIKEWVLFLISKWKIIFLFGLIGGLISLTIVLYEKPTYKAVLTFAMEEEKGGGGGLSGALGLASSFGIDLGGGGGGAFASNNLTELMKSRLIVEKVILKPININGKLTNLAEFYIKNNNLRKIWDNNPRLKNISFYPVIDRSKFSLQQDSIILKIYNSLINSKNLIIQQVDKKVTILSITVKSENELFSKLFCENLAFETSEFYIYTRSKKSKINTEVLKNQVDSVRLELNKAITGVASEADNVYNLNPSLNIKSTNSKKKQIDVQANTAILTNLVVQYELSKITLRKETPLIQLIDSPILPLEKKKSSKSFSVILGTIIGSFFTCLFYIFIRLYKKLDI